MNQKEEVMNILRDLKDSPLLSGEFHTTIGNLGGVISHLSTGAVSEIESLKDDLKQKRFDIMEKRLTSLIYRLFEIGTVADIIQEKADNEDLNKLCDLVSLMEEIEEFKINN